MLEAKVFLYCVSIHLPKASNTKAGVLCKLRRVFMDLKCLVYLGRGYFDPSYSDTD